MKLYEFTITDNKGLKENQVLEHAEQIMVSEAEANGWTACNVEKTDAGEKQLDGSMQYSFVVHGEVIENLKDQNSGESTPAPGKERLAASPPLEIS